MKSAHNLERYCQMLPHDVLSEISEWKGDPELEKLLLRLDRSSDRQFFDTYAEVLVARHLLKQNCRLRVEVPTPSGQSADFEAVQGGLRFFVHIKRLSMEGATLKQLDISKRTRSLEKIKRPLVAELSFQRDLADPEMQEFVKRASSFLKNGRVGEKMLFKQEDGTTVGKCVIAMKWNGDHVTTIVMPAMRWTHIVGRLYDLLSKAYKQFMPEALNIILVTGECADTGDFKDALFGTQRATVLHDGTVVSTERLPDGFWSTEKHAHSKVAGRFEMSTSLDGIALKLWERPSACLAPDMEDLLSRLGRTYQAVQPSVQASSEK